jgi:hypothetical protein
MDAFHLRGMADASEHQRFLKCKMSQGHRCQACFADWMLWQKHSKNDLEVKIGKRPACHRKFASLGLNP